MEHFWIHVSISLLLFLANRIKLGEATGKKTGKDDFVTVHVPAFVREGGTAFLKCLYDVDNDKLYSMKWYKGTLEFFRFTPKESPPIKTFPTFGGHVDLRLSNTSDVALVNVDLNMTEKYTCEVTKDFPDYTTSMRGGKMTVVASPEKRPSISTTRRFASIGDTLTVNCTSSRSSPIANITWLLNGFPVGPHYLTSPFTSRDEDNKETITIGLNFTVRQQHFIRSRMTITCQVRIEPDMYFDSEEVHIMEQDSPKISSVADNYSADNRKKSDSGRIIYNAGTSPTIPSAICITFMQLFLRLVVNRQSHNMQL